MTTHDEHFIVIFITRYEKCAWKGARRRGEENLNGTGGLQDRGLVEWRIGGKGGSCIEAYVYVLIVTECIFGIEQDGE